MGIPKLSLPPKLSDTVLRCLDWEPLVKYHYLYYKYRSLLNEAHTLSFEERLRVGYALDWFRQANFLASTHSRWWGLGYIKDTWPVGEWPQGYDSVSTVRALEYAYHKLVGNPIPEAFLETLMYVYGKNYRCCFCGSICSTVEPVLRKGALGCQSCSGRLTSPVKVFLMADGPSEYLERYRALIGNAVVPAGKLNESDLVHVFMMNGDPKRQCEELICRAATQNLSIMVLERLSKG